MTEAEVSQFTSMHVQAIKPSPDNPRKHFDPTALEDLAANIREHGIISPLVVRRVEAIGNGTPAHHEIVSGERRWRAAQLAGLREVPVRILQLSDAAALEIQVVENLQRSDIHELEEADGYKALQDRYGYTVEDLAAKVGKSEAYIYGRLKLTSLVDQAARDAFFSGTIAPTVALFIARLSPKLQAEATKTVLEGEYDPDTQGRMPYSSTRAALAALRRAYTLRLADAPFSTESEELITAAGACTSCPKRSGNAPTLFAVETPDVCTDPPCYEAKTKRHHAILVEDAKATGREVLEGKKAKAIFPYDGDTVAQGYVSLAAREWSYGDGREAVQERPWRERLGEHCPVPTIVVHPKTREAFEVITAEQLRAAKKAAGIRAEKTEHSDAPKSRNAAAAEEEKKARAKEEAKRLQRVERSRDVASSALRIICEAIVLDEKVTALQDPLAFVLAAHPAGRVVLVDAGLLPEKDRLESFAYDRMVVKACEQLSARQIVALLVRAAVHGPDCETKSPGVHSYTGEYNAELKAIVGMFERQVSLKDLEKKATNARVTAAALAEEGKEGRRCDRDLQGEGPEGRDGDGRSAAHRHED